MPFEVKLEYVPAGYSITGARKGETCEIVVCEFTSSEDGDHFVNRLEGLPTALLNLLPPGNQVLCSMVDHLLAIIRRDQTATLFVNELAIKMGVRAKGSIQQGQTVLVDDIADIETLEVVGIEIPQDAGLVFLWSHGWRKGLFYDLEPLRGEPGTSRRYNLKRMLAQQHSYLMFQDLFKISEQEWDGLISKGWFPFVSMNRSTIKDMIGTLRAGFDLDEFTERFAGEFNLVLPEKVKARRTNAFFSEHLKVFEAAAERHLSEDFISSTSILYPRLEGLMRTYHLSLNNAVYPKSDNLVRTLGESVQQIKHAYSLFLPRKFLRYLKEFYFAGFDARDPKGFSRDTVAHGVAPVSEFSMKYSLIGFLILDQLFFCMRPPVNP
jgi:hypothetical protein